MSLPALTGTIAQGGSCSSAAPTGVYMKSSDSSENHHVTVIGVGGGGEVTLNIADGETVGVVTHGFVDPTIRIHAKGFIGGGDTPTSWSWACSSSNEGAVVAAPDPLPTEEDMGSSNPIHILLQVPELNPQITIAVTGTNCGGSDTSSNLTFTVSRS